MHVLYVHPNFPAQLGPIALQLARTPGLRCTAVSEPTGGAVSRVEVIRYQRAGGARPENHFCSRSFENAVWNCDGVYRTLAAGPDIRPDLVVGHSGFGSTLFLRELYPDVPVINLFEYYYRPHHPQDLTNRPRQLTIVIPTCTMRHDCGSTACSLAPNPRVGKVAGWATAWSLRGEFHETINLGNHRDPWIGPSFSVRSNPRGRGGTESR